MKKFILVIFLLPFLFPDASFGQTPSDDLMMKQRWSCWAIGYDQGKFDHYWEGTNLRVNGTIASVTRTTVTPMVAIGLHDRLNLLIMTPYVQTRSSEPNGGKLQGVNGFQDVSLFLKGQILDQQIGKGKLGVLATLGFATPMTNYLSDYQPYSLGLGTQEVSFRGIFQYRLDLGVYARASVAYLWRGQTEIERDTYYNNGMYYSNRMDVPSAWNYQGTIGSWFLKNKLKVEASYIAMKSTSGDDIRRYNAPQPTNRVEIGQVNFFSQVWLPKPKGLGAYAYYSHIVSGRNIGQLTNLGVGITYQFKI